MLHSLYVAVCVMLIIMLMVMAHRLARSKPSGLTVGMLIYIFATMFSDTAYLIELYCDTVQAYRIVIRIEYLGWAFQNVMMLWIVSLFTNNKPPRWFTALQFFNAVGIIAVVMTMHLHNWYARDIQPVYNGYFVQCKVTPGWFYHYYYINVYISVIIMVYWCVKKYLSSTGVTRKRMKWASGGLLANAVLNILYYFGLTRGLDMFTFGTFAIICCFYRSFLQYGYFNSIQAGMENAVDYIKEGFLIVSPEGKVLYKNKQVDGIAPNLRLNDDVTCKPQFKAIFFEGKSEVDIEGKVYQVRFDEINDYDSLIGYMVWLIDMTEHYRHLDELKELTRRAEQASMAKTAFLANMSHEIRTPMNSILGMDELIIRESKNQNVQRYAVNIYNAGKALLSIINDVLDISKIESGKAELQEREYELSSLINDIYNMTRIKADSKGLGYGWSIAEDVPNYLFGDEVRVRQIILNIVNNAIKYTPSGEVKIELSGSRYDDGKIVLRVLVRDTGIGIKKSDMNKLFGKFTRLDGSVNRNIEGTGLGLNIANQLVSMMGGQIKVESEYGRGSEFTVFIPQHIVRDIPIGGFKDAIENVVNEGMADKRHLMTRNANVLVVDDNTMNLEVIIGLLKPTMINVHTAESGYKALELMAQRHYDLMLLDQMMPGMSGIETLEQLKKRGLANDTPVIALTAEAVMGAREKFLACGFNDYLSKPVRWERLEALIAQYLPKEKIIDTESREHGEKYGVIIAVSDYIDRMKELREALGEDYQVICVKNMAQVREYVENTAKQ